MGICHSILRKKESQCTLCEQRFDPLETNEKVICNNCHGCFHKTCIKPFEDKLLLDCVCPHCNAEGYLILKL